MTMRILIFTLMLLLVNGTLSAETGLVVITAIHTTIVKGTIIKPTQTIELQSGESLKLLSSTGGIIQLQGPYSGAIVFDAKACYSAVL